MERLRSPGAGRKCSVALDPGLAAARDRLVVPVARGVPQSALRWTCKRATQLADELTRLKHRVSPPTVGRLVKATGYRLQRNPKTKEGGAHPDRNAQIEYINGTAPFSKSPHCVRSYPADWVARLPRPWHTGSWPDRAGANLPRIRVTRKVTRRHRRNGKKLPETLDALLSPEIVQGRKVRLMFQDANNINGSGSV